MEAENVFKTENAKNIEKDNFPKREEKIMICGRKMLKKEILLIYEIIQFHF